MKDPKGAALLIERFEGFIAHAMWDVNHYRVGYGSDTEGPEQTPVTKQTTTTTDRAMQNLEARLPKFEWQIIKQIGQRQWATLPAGAQNALLSLCYNYGHLPDGVAEAAASGNLPHLAAAVAARATDNQGVNHERRAEEAAAIRSSQHVA